VVSTAAFDTRPAQSLCLRRDHSRAEHAAAVLARPSVVSSGAL